MVLRDISPAPIDVGSRVAASAASGRLPVS